MIPWPTKALIKDINQMEHLVSGVGGTPRTNKDSPRFETRPEFLLEQMQGGAAIRAASIVTEQHSKNKVFSFEEAAHVTGLRQFVSQHRGRLPNRSGLGADQRVVNRLHVDKKIGSCSPAGNKQLARLHSAKNLLRRVNDQPQDLLSHEQDSALNEGDVSSFHPDDLNKISSRLDTDQETSSNIIRTSSQQVAKQRELGKNQLAAPKQPRRASLAQSNQPIGSSAQRSANPNANVAAEKVSPQKAAKESILSRLQKSQTSSQPKTQLKNDKWFSMQSGRHSGSSSTPRDHDSPRDQSDSGVIQLPYLNRKKSQISGNMSAFLEDAGVDSSLNQSFSLSQANYQMAGDMQPSQLSYRVGQSNLRETSSEYWKSATSQKLQSEKQAKDKLESSLDQKERQQPMTSKKQKAIQTLTSSSRKELPDKHAAGVEPIESKVVSHHRAQQSMDNSTMPFQIDKSVTKNQRGAIGRLDKKINAVTSALQPEELKSCLTERRAPKAANGSSTTSAATQNNNLPAKGSSYGQQTRNERARLNRNLHNQRQHGQPKNESNVSNQTTGGGSTGSRRSQSSQNELRSGPAQKKLRRQIPSNTDLNSAQHQTPKGAYFSISRQLAPSNSSLPPSSLADDQCSQEDEYQSMWAAISKSIDQTNESNYMAPKDGDISYAVDLDQDTEFSGYQQHFFSQSLCPSNQGQMDQNSSFHCSQSQASQFGQDLDSSFYESATNSTWAKSERNSYALKSQHSCSTYNKQGAQQQPQQVAQQTSGIVAQQNATQGVSGPATYLAGYPRRPSCLEESKGAQTASAAASYANAQTGQSNAGNQDAQISPVSQSNYALKALYQGRASEPEESDKKFTAKAHRGGKTQTNGMQQASQQDLQSQASLGQTQTSKEHQRVEQTPGSARHSSFTGMGLSGYISNSGGYSQRGQTSGEDVKIAAGEQSQSRAQISQSVQPVLSRSATVSSQINQFVSSPQGIHNQAVPLGNYQAAVSMSASRQTQPQQSQTFDFTPQQHAQSGPNQPPQVSNFSATAQRAQVPPTQSQSQQQQQTHFNPHMAPSHANHASMMQMMALQSPHMYSSNLGSFQPHLSQPQAPTMTIFTPYNPSQAPAYYPQHPSSAQMQHSQQHYPQQANFQQSPIPQLHQQYHLQRMDVPQLANQTLTANNNITLSTPQTSHEPRLATTSTTSFSPLPPQSPTPHYTLPQQQNPQLQAPPSLAQLNEQLGEIERFYHVERVPCPLPDFQAYLGQIRGIQDPAQRAMAQQNLIFHLQHLLKGKQQSLMMAASQRHPFQGQSVGYDHRRDYSSSSSASKISSSSSVSSQQRSSHQNNLKIALASAFRDLEKLQSAEERTQFLVSKAHLFAKDKNGFQLLKNKIDEEVFQLQQLGNPKNGQKQQSKFVSDLFSLLLSPEFTAFHKLMMHQVANFFCQELFRQAQSHQLELVIEVIKNDFFKIAADMHGTRALQVLLQDELIQNERRTERMPALLQEALKNGRIFELCCNIRGNHVIRQCLILLKTDERRAMIYDPVVQNFAQIARDKHGCQVVKDCITTAQAQWKKDLIRVSQESIELLINDEYGNFVIQAILDHFISISKRKSKIMDVRVSCFYEFIRLNLGKLCKQQYSSRVVEKAIETMPKEQFEKVCLVLMKSSSKKCKLFKEIMLDSFGNYIAPKILERAKAYGFQHQFDYFNKVYRESIEALKKVKHGRQLMVKINQILQSSSSNAASKGKQSANGNSQNMDDQVVVQAAAQAFNPSK